MADFLIGRQQILDSNLAIFGYELLFRGQDFDLKQCSGASQATNQVITDSILELGLNEIVGQQKAFINFTAQNILEKTPLNLPKDRIVIEVLENVTIDLRIINNLREFHQQGYMIALDDFILTDEWLPLLEFVDLIKLDIMELGSKATQDTIDMLRPYNIALLAEKVETREQFESLRDLGCIYFQGFFFSKPQIIKGRRIGINQAAAIKLLSIINNPDVQFNEISKVISQDPGMSFKLLHYINSAFFSVPNKIESIQHAITCLGLAEIKRWSNILTLSSLTEKSAAILQNSLVRAKFCEQLAEQSGQETELFFLVGLLSCLDSMLNLPIQEALAQLSLSPDVTEAILQESGPAGEALQCAINYEHWKTEKLHYKDLDLQTIGGIYMQSIAWTKDVMGSMA